MLAITVVAGCVDVDQAVANVARTLRANGRSEVSDFKYKCINLNILFTLRLQQLTFHDFIVKQINTFLFIKVCKV